MPSGGGLVAQQAVGRLYGTVLPSQVPRLEDKNASQKMLVVVSNKMILRGEKPIE